MHLAILVLDWCLLEIVWALWSGCKMHSWIGLHLNTGIALAFATVTVYLHVWLLYDIEPKSIDFFEDICSQLHDLRHGIDAHTESVRCEMSIATQCLALSTSRVCNKEQSLRLCLLQHYPFLWAENSRVHAYNCALQRTREWNVNWM